MRSDPVSSSSDASRCTRAAEPPSPVAVGDPAPDVVLHSPGGPRTSLSELRGAPVVISFHSPRWNPSRAAYVASYNQLVDRISRSKSARLLNIGDGDGVWSALAFGDETVALPFIEASHRADDDAIARAFGVAGISAVFVIDTDGIVQWRHLGTIDALPSPDILARALRALTAEPEASTASAIDESRPSSREEPTGRWTRRDNVATALAASLALLIDSRRAHGSPVASAVADRASPVPAVEIPVRLTVNGREIVLEIEPRVTLLDALRERAGLTGSKKGCDHGQCGACTVHVDGRRTLSCLTLAVMAQGKAITTIEGLAPAPGDALHPVQQAFLEHDGFQCGYCTPGQIMSAAAVLQEPWGPGDDDVREAMSGNICRCGAYPGIVAAVQDARQRLTRSR